MTWRRTQGEKGQVCDRFLYIALQDTAATKTEVLRSYREILIVSTASSKLLENYRRHFSYTS